MAQTESHLEATLNYCAKDPLYDVEKPYQVVLDLHGIPGATNSNHKYEAVKQVPIFDVRTVTRAPLLDKEGFQLVNIGSGFDVSSFEDPAWVVENYYPFVCGFVKDFLSAKELRYRQPGFGDAKLRPALQYQPPVPIVHSDQSERSARARFFKHWPDFTEEMWVERWQIIKYDQSVLFPYFANRSGVWRPLNEIVTEWPLALCDDQTVDKARDFRNSDLVTRDYEGESVLGIWNPDHRRYYASEQKFHEAWLVKLYDAIRMSQQRLYTLPSILDLERWAGEAVRLDF